MIIYPAIDIKDRACVRLTQGAYEKMTVYQRNPVKVAKDWEDRGASILHIVDLDGARLGERVNEPVVREILKAIRIPVQLGGGIRDTQSIKTFLDVGVAQVIVGTAALKDKEWIREMIGLYRERIVVSIDAKKGWMATDGWETLSKVRAVDYIKELESYGLKRIVYTDIEKDGMLKGPNFQMYEELLRKVSLEVIASGGISTVEDVKALREMGLYGGIIGKALYNGNLQIEEVLNC